MKYARLYAGPDGESHFDDVEVALTPGAVSSDLSAPMPVEGIMFLRGRAGGAGPSWHHAPRRQFVITLTGEPVVTASDGEQRRFGPGAVLFVEDLTGKGHLTEPRGTDIWRALFLPLPGEDVTASAGAAVPPEVTQSYQRIYTGADGESHFETVDVPAASVSATGLTSVSALIPAKTVFFRRSPMEYHYDFHNAPRRQFVVVLSGGVEIVTGHNEAKRLGPGGVLLAEDKTGRGHISRNAGDTERMTVFVTLE